MHLLQSEEHLEIPKKQQQKPIQLTSDRKHQGGRIRSEYPDRSGVSSRDGVEGRLLVVPGGFHEASDW